MQHLAASGPLGLMARPLRMRSRSFGMPCRLAFQCSAHPTISFDMILSVLEMAQVHWPMQGVLTA
jgi:hypothetical protein